MHYIYLPAKKTGMKLYLCLLSILLATSLYSQQTLSYSRVEIPLNTTNLKTLSQLGIAVDHGAKLPGNKFSTDLSVYEIGLLDKNNIPYNISIKDVTSYYQTRKSSGAPSLNRDASVCFPDKPFTPPVNFTYGSMGGFYTYEEFLAVLDDMKAKFPNLISTYKPIDAFKTIDKNPILWLRISNKPEIDEDKPEILYTSLIHAREPESLSQLIYFMWYILENYDTDPNIKAMVDNTEMYFVPMINPDGYRFNQSTNPAGGGLWRKNRRINKDNYVGIDLNRNYGKYWGYDNSGSSNDPQSDVYRGTSAFSEVETQAMKSLCLQHHFKLALNYHTYGNDIIYPWGHDGSNCVDSLQFRLISDRLVDINKFTAGTSIETVGYFVNGDSDDWMYGDTTQKPAIFAMTPEVGEFYDGFWPFLDRILPLSNACLEMNLQLLKSAHNNMSISYKNIPALTGKDTKISFEAIQTGLIPANTTVEVSDPSGKMIFTQPSQTILQNTSTVSSIDFDIKWGNVANGDKIMVHYAWGDGMNYFQDSVEISFYDVRENLFYDDCSTTDNWFLSGSWGVTTEDSYSGGTCLTDSPYSKYTSQAVSQIVMKNPINNTAAYDRMFVKYRGKWYIEHDFDYAAVILNNQTNQSKNYLCAYGMTKGTLEQAGEQSVYEGNALKWEEEVIDISAYKNTDFTLQFEIGADGGDERDGFYVDDIEIVAFREKTTQTSNEGFTKIQIYPNPTHDALHFKTEQNVAKVELIDILGKTVFIAKDETLNNNNLQLPSSLSNGTYFIKFFGNNLQILSIQKVILMR